MPAPQAVVQPAAPLFAVLKSHNPQESTALSRGSFMDSLFKCPPPHTLIKL